MENLGITGVSFVYCTKFCVLSKLKYRAQTISLIWIPFLSLRISLRLFLQFYRRRWGRSIGLCHRVKNKISQKDAKCIPSCVTAGIVFCAGESFGVLRLGTSPQISFSNENLIKQFTTCRLAISQNIPWLPPPPSPPEKKFSVRTVCTSLGTTKIPRINEKQRLCKFFPNCNIHGLQSVRDRSLFIARRGGGGGFGGITWFLGKQKGGSVVTENPKRGITETFGRIQRGEPLKFAWKMKTWWGRDRESHQMLLGGSLQWSNIQSGDRLNFTLFAPNLPPPPNSRGNK